MSVPEALLASLEAHIIAALASGEPPATNLVLHFQFAHNELRDFTPEDWSSPWSITSIVAAAQHAGPAAHLSDTVWTLSALAGCTSEDLAQLPLDALVIGARDGDNDLKWKVTQVLLNALRT